MFQVFMADLRRMNAFDRPITPRAMPRLHYALLPGVWAVAIFRAASWCHLRGIRPVSRLLYLLNFVLTGADICPAATIGPGFMLAHPNGVTIGGGVIIGRDGAVFHQTSIGPAALEDMSMDGSPRLGDGVFVFAGARVHGPIDIGDGAMIGVNSVVYMKSIPPGALVKGNPGRVSGFRDGHAPPEVDAGQGQESASHAKPHGGGHS